MIQGWNPIFGGCGQAIWHAPSGSPALREAGLRSFEVSAASTAAADSRPMLSANVAVWPLTVSYTHLTLPTKA